MSVNVEELCSKYSITEGQGELLMKKLETNNTKDETQVIAYVTQIIMLSQKLEQLGFDPNLYGCEALVACIPVSTRNLYSEATVDAAIEYLSNMS